MSRKGGPLARFRSLRLGRVEELLLLGIVLFGAAYPMLREALPAAIPVLCGLPTPDGTAITHRALAGKVACVLALTLLVPLAARVAAGSWAALARAPAYRVALCTAATAATTLTAYDACTGFHATQRTTEGCACWLTAAVAGIGALAAALLILGGRALLGLVRDALVALARAVFRRRRSGAPLFSTGRRAAPAIASAVRARPYAGRAPPGLFSHSV